jgi:hypothetical protein
MDREESSYSETSENESVASSQCSSDSVSSASSYPVADGPQYRQRAQFYRAVKKLAGRRRAFTARCARIRSFSGSSGADSIGEETLPYNRLCVPEENGLTADDISRLQGRPGVSISGQGIIRKSPSLPRSRTYRNPTRA